MGAGLLTTQSVVVRTKNYKHAVSEKPNSFAQEVLRRISMPSKQTCDRLFCSTLLLLLAINCAAQNNVKSSVANPVPEAVKELLAYPYPPVQRSLIGGLWMTDASSTSTLIIKNNLSTSALTVHPVLFPG